MEWKIIGEICGGILVILLGGQKIISIVQSWVGEKHNSVDGCPDAACQESMLTTVAEVRHLKIDLGRMEGTIGIIFPKLDKVAGDVAFVRGWIEGKDGKRPV